VRFAEFEVVKKREIIEVRNPQAVFRCGYSFEVTAVLVAASLQESRSVPDKSESGNPPLGYAPYASLCALSAEHYLKSLIWAQEYDVPKQTHDLVELFDRLSEPTKRIARRHFANEIAEIGERKFGDEVVTEPITLDSALRVSRLSFETWRYIYEDNVADGEGQLYLISKAFYWTIIERNPTWQSIERENPFISRSQMPTQAARK